VTAPRARRASVEVEVFEDLVRPRPILRRNDEVDVAAPEPVERMVGGAPRLKPHVPQLVAPAERGLLILKRADRLPVLKAGISDRDRGLGAGATP